MEKNTFRKMIRVYFDIPAVEYLPEDNPMRCAATIEDILWYTNFPVQDMLLEKTRALAKRDNDTAQMCKLSIEMYMKKREILNIMKSNIGIQILSTDSIEND